jgi:hypothetical protein
MQALYDDERRNLIRLSIMMVCGGAAILPLTVSPTSLAASAQSAPRYSQISVPAVPSRLAFPAISVERDPFVPDLAAVPNPPSPPFVAVHQGDSIAVELAPKAGGSDSSGPFVRGIVLGDEPQVLMELGGTVKVLGIGDAVGDQKIAAIDGDGVTLSNGVRLRLTSATQ